MTNHVRIDNLGIGYRTLTAGEIERALALHLRYVQGQRGGMRVCLKFCDLSRANLAGRILAGRRTSARRAWSARTWPAPT
ncbi:hypothetical protein IGS68_30995 (plasmid) [Skermanella sp. TT6]|uniref:STAS domain-containing protein n=1 Tax=Skermanella cutis TaxID=2775420 RepID=A0ABX7BHV1_9PROT|nr:hypothetical protein [Skermanella sp. TT6]QQP92868.1 hypothetical protein IGS68_30995 [Skermanella sp. TT6]